MSLSESSILKKKTKQEWLIYFSLFSETDWSIPVELDRKCLNNAYLGLQQDFTGWNISCRWEKKTLTEITDFYICMYKINMFR